MTIKVGDVVAHVESGVTGKVTFVTPQGTAVDVLDPHGGTYCFQTHMVTRLPRVTDGCLEADPLGAVVGLHNALAAVTTDRDTLRAQLAAVTAERDKLQRAYDESAQKADSHRRLYEQALRTMDGMHEARGQLQRECDELRAKIAAALTCCNEWSYIAHELRPGLHQDNIRECVTAIHGALNSKVTT